MSLDPFPMVLHLRKSSNGVRIGSRQSPISLLRERERERERKKSKTQTSIRPATFT